MAGTPFMRDDLLEDEVERIRSASTQVLRSVSADVHEAARFDSANLLGLLRATVMGVVLEQVLCDRRVEILDIDSTDGGV